MVLDLPSGSRGSGRAEQIMHIHCWSCNAQAHKVCPSLETRPVLVYLPLQPFGVS